MPNYAYHCTSCDAKMEKMVPISQRDDFCNKSCPFCGKKTIERSYDAAPAAVDPVRLGVRKVDNGFKEVLHKIHETNYGSKLNQSKHY